MVCIVCSLHSSSERRPDLSGHILTRNLSRLLQVLGGWEAPVWSDFRFLLALWQKCDWHCSRTKKSTNMQFCAVYQRHICQQFCFVHICLQSEMTIKTLWIFAALEMASGFTGCRLQGGDVKVGGGWGELQVGEWRWRADVGLTALPL